VQANWRSTYSLIVVWLPVGEGDWGPTEYLYRPKLPATVAAQRSDMGQPEPGPAEVPYGSNRTEDTMYNERRVALAADRAGGRVVN
jgi:hypothetical protein